MDVETRFRDLSKQLRAGQNLPISMIGRAHGPTHGAIGESLLRELLRRFLPRTVEVGTGFVIAGGEQSTEIDILIYDAGAPTLDRDGERVFVTSDAVRGLIEVKATLNRSNLGQAIEKLLRNEKLVARNRGEAGGQFTIGLFGYNISLPDSRRLDWVLRQIQRSSTSEGLPIFQICLGASYFVRYWHNEPGRWMFHDYRRWHLYEMKDMAFGYFVSNVVEAISPEFVHRNQKLWYPEVGKESYLVESAPFGPA